MDLKTSKRIEQIFLAGLAGHAVATRIHQSTSEALESGVRSGFPSPAKTWNQMIRHTEQPRRRWSIDSASCKQSPQESSFVNPWFLL
jgi:hypothetical protein